MNELICIGKTISTFGIKGELKVISGFERVDDAFKVGRKILLNNITHTITSIRYHKNLILMGIDNFDNINQVLEYVGFNIYIEKEDLNLSEEDYLYSDLINASVIEENEILGTIKEVEYGVKNDFVKVSGEKEFLIPLIPNFIEKFDKENKVLYVKNAKDLII